MTTPTEPVTPPNEHEIVVIGAGPAGLTASYQLAKAGVTCTVVEADDTVGGISRTVERDGWRFDIGGHRFFTKVPEVETLWHEILPDEEFLLRPRMSRIYYNGTFFDYPLRARNALKGLGVVESARCIGSYLWVRIRRPADTTTFEGWTASRFGWRLYRIFFKTYTEKVWGVPASAIQADWAAQRIKNLSLGKAIVNSLLPHRNQTEITSLIEEFQYPKYGPGMMWEVCRDKVVAAGTEVRLERRVVRVEHAGGEAHAVVVDGLEGEQRLPATSVISSMPINELLRAMDPPVPPAVQAAADALQHRDFLTVALVIPERYAFPDNWIYVHEPGVKLGRIQNFGSWSPYLVQDGRTCLGLEYFVNEGDEWWGLPDEQLVDLGTRELQQLGLVDPGVVEAGYVVRMPKAYPVYDAEYADNVDVLRAWLDEHASNVHPVGRNGMHKYNNQDHSMYTAMLTVENILKGTNHDIWAVNVEQEYHEERGGNGNGGSGSASSGSSGTGRAAPVIG
jgi:protoporphyrinogen oxidase